MRTDQRFLQQPKHFWAEVKLISQEVGYTDRKTKQLRIPTFAQIYKAHANLNLGVAHLFGRDQQPTEYGQVILDYFAFRAHVLETRVEKLLMNKEEAKALFEKVAARQKFKCPIPVNRQKLANGEPNYLVGLVNMLVERTIGDAKCDYAPVRLTTIIKDNKPLRTLSRRVDGAFPSVVNPLAIWEVKEYYYTTSFGSRVADGVYETLLDGLELEELQQNEGRQVLHYLIIDGYLTWWKMGRSYLCRMIDMLHQGYVDEILFGREIVKRIPQIATEWLELQKRR